MSKLTKKYNPNLAHFIILIGLSIIIPSGFYFLEGLLISLLFFNWLFLWAKNKVIFKTNKTFFLLFGLFTVYLFGLITTSDLSEQLEATTKHISYVIIPLSLIGFKLTENQIQTIKKAFIWSTIFFVTVAVIYGFCSYFSTGKSTTYVNDSVQSKFMYYGLTRVFDSWHPTYVSFFCNLSLVFVHQVYYKSKVFQLSIITVIVLLTGVFLLNSFIGILTTTCLILFFLLSLVQSLRLKATITTLVVLFSILFYYINPFGLSKIEKLKQTEITITDLKPERNILNLRLAKWQTSLELFKAYPLLGVSAGGYKKVVVERYKQNGFDYAAQHQYAAHNFYIYTLASSGLIGLLFFLIALIFPFFKTNDASVFLIIFSLFCLTEDMLLRQQGVVAFTYFYVILQTKKIYDD